MTDATLSKDIRLVEKRKTQSMKWHNLLLIFEMKGYSRSNKVKFTEIETSQTERNEKTRKTPETWRQWPVKGYMLINAGEPFNDIILLVFDVRKKPCVAVG